MFLVQSYLEEHLGQNLMVSFLVWMTMMKKMVNLRMVCLIVTMVHSLEVVTIIVEPIINPKALNLEVNN